MDCRFPHNTAQTAYWKGCRCPRCKTAKSLTSVGRPIRTMPCPSCDGQMTPAARSCARCFKRPVLDRLMEKIRIEGECWIFTGEINRSGYGRIRIAPGRSQVTHRVTYEHYVGSVPDELELDHLCENTACCNPDHLEAVTHSVNMQRIYSREALT